MSTPAPKKYVKINGVMKLNPEYKAWKERQTAMAPGPNVPATTVANPSQALPVVTNMDDFEQLNEVNTAHGEPEIPLSESTNATIEMMQEPEISLEAGMQPDTMVDELGAVLNKYEIPMGLMNKLMMLSEFEALEFIVDDSGSMTLQSDSVNKAGLPQTRWEEAQSRLLELLEIVAYVPFQKVTVEFLNRRDRLDLVRQGRTPPVFLKDATRQVQTVFARSPSGSTPVLEKLQESFIRGAGRNIARYFMGDGQPNGGVQAQKEICNILVRRDNPSGNPMTFLSCTNEDAQVEWMKDVEEIAPFCSEADDFHDESAEVLKDQGPALPYTRGFYLVASLTAASNPDDLDAMDESVPFTKATLDNLLGIQHDETNYKHYFDLFVQAQRQRKVEIDRTTGRPKALDQLKKNANWESVYQSFLTTPVANQIPAVQNFKRQLAAAE